MTNETITCGQGWSHLCSPLYDAAPSAPDSLQCLPWAYEIPPNDVRLPLLAPSQPSSDDVDLDLGSKACSAPSMAPQFLLGEMSRGH